MESPMLTPINQTTLPLFENDSGKVSMEAVLRKIVQTIKKHEIFVLTTHVNPDGDGLGSEVAMYQALKRMNKKPIIINTSETPRQYQFLNKGRIIHTYNPARHDRIIKKADVILVLDISVSKRLDRMQPVVLTAPAVKICIDHHLDNDHFAQLTFADDKAPATAELIYNFIRQELKQKIDKSIAEPLYTGLITDTGNFRFNATRPETLRIAADFLQMGIRPNEIYSNVFEQGSINTIKLLGLLLERIKPECGSRFHWTYLSQDDFTATQTKPSDTEGFVDYTLKLENSVMGALFYETPDHYTKISLRAKGNVNVQKFAKGYGGGGHFSASGILIKAPFMPTIEKMVKELVKYFETHYGTGK